MRFAPIKNIEQLAVVAVHRVRQGLVKARTAEANQIRGLLGAYGLVVPLGIAYVTKRVPALMKTCRSIAWHGSSGPQIKAFKASGAPRNGRDRVNTVSPIVLQF